MLPLKGTHIVSLAANLPGPIAASRLREMGASITKIEPSFGDLWCVTVPNGMNGLSKISK